MLEPRQCTQNHRPKSNGQSLIYGGQLPASPPIAYVLNHARRACSNPGEHRLTTQLQKTQQLIETLCLPQTSHHGRSVLKRAQKQPAMPSHQSRLAQSARPILLPIAKPIHVRHSTFCQEQSANLPRALLAQKPTSLAARPASLCQASAKKARNTRAMINCRRMPKSRKKARKQLARLRACQLIYPCTNQSPR